jgi:hypothetical protein
MTISNCLAPLSLVTLIACAGMLPSRLWASDGAATPSAGGDQGLTWEGKKNYHHFVQFGYQPGLMLQSNDFVRGDNATGEPIRRYTAGRLEFGWQTTGAEPWHQIWNFPAFGVGFYTVDYLNENEIGNPKAIYGFINLPVRRWDRWTLSVRPGFGVSYNWKPFDPVSNPNNIAIGDFKAAYIDLGAELSYALSPHWDAALGASFTHFSNGGTRKPNTGFNQVGPIVQMRYNFEDTRPSFTVMDVAPFEKRHEATYSIAYGTRSVGIKSDDPALIDKYGRVNFKVITLSAAWMTQVSHKSKFGIGVDLVHDSATEAQLDSGNGIVDTVRLPLLEESRLGVYGTYEYVIHDLSIFGDIGYTILQKGFDNQLPRLYQRLGFKYHFLENFFAGLSVRFKNFDSADHLQWTMGYRRAL